MPFLEAGGHRLEYRRIAGAGRPIVMLHEGLGSVSMWKNFPDEVARITGHEVVLYSRYGHGQSDGLTAPRHVRYMHEEASIALPEFLSALALDQPILLGHSDGASIALLFAGMQPRSLAGLIALAPHVFVEELSVSSIAKAKVAYATTDLRSKLARYHADVDATFRGWNDIWLDPAFRAWNIEEWLAPITVPTLVAQGVDDEYGTLEQVRRIERAVRQATVVELAHCGHSPHRDQPGALLTAIQNFVQGLPDH